MTRPSCSVLIPTHGAARYLREVLDGIVAQTVSDLEVVVVDNNVTPTLGRRLGATLDHRVRIVHQPHVGLSRARNTAVANGRGAWLAFLDDDTVPNRDWLEALLEGIGRYHAAVVGGGIDLEFRGDPPDWLDQHHRRLLAELHYDGQDIPCLGEDQYICGGNLAAHATTFRELGGFAESFGRGTGTLRSSEELEWCRRAQTLGRSVAFLPAARVRHIIDPSRLTLRYSLRRAYWQGRSDAMLDSRHGRPAAFGVRSLRRNVVALAERLLALVASGEMRTRVSALTALCRECGYSLEYVRCLSKRREGWRV